MLTLYSDMLAKSLEQGKLANINMQSILFEQKKSLILNKVHYSCSNCNMLQYPVENQLKSFMF